MLIILAMALGLIVPKMCIEYFYPGLNPTKMVGHGLAGSRRPIIAE
jgi:hypothetical protein